MTRAILTVLVLLLTWGVANAQPTPGNVSSVKVCDSTTITNCAPVDPTLGMKVQATVSATVTGFAPNGNSATLAVTNATGNVALPAGAAIFVSNTGANAAFVKLGTSNAVTAATTDFPVQANVGGQCFAVGSNTFIAAITASSTATLNIQGGTGLCGPIPGSSASGGTQPVNVAQVNGVTTLTGAGATGTGAQRVTAAQDTTTIAGSAPGTAGTASANVVTVQGVASMTPVATSVASGGIASGAIASGAVASGAFASGSLASGAGTDGWDATEGAKADAVCGTATGTCSLTALIKFLNQTAAAAIPAGTNNIGKIDILGNAGGTLDTASGTAAGTGFSVQGMTASGATLTDAPLADGGRAATTQPTAVTDGQKVAFMATTQGRLVVQPYAPSALVNNNQGSSTSTTAITVMSASGSASFKEYMTDLHCGRSDAGTTAITLAVSDGTTTFTVVLPNAGAGGQANFRYSTPRAWAANTAVTVVPSAGVSTLYCDAEGYNAP